MCARQATATTVPRARIHTPAATAPVASGTNKAKKTPQNRKIKIKSFKTSKNLQNLSKICPKAPGSDAKPSRSIPKVPGALGAMMCGFGLEYTPPPH